MAADKLSEKPETRTWSPFSYLVNLDVSLANLSLAFMIVFSVEMGAAQSTPEPPAAHDILDTPALSSSPPHPSRSTLNPATPLRSGLTSYFLPITTPDLQHSHLSPTLENIREVSDALSTKLPPELVVRVLEEAKYWAGCRTLITKDLVVVAGTPTPRGPPRGWRSGQESHEGLERLKDGIDGEVWYLASEPVGCDESSLNSRADGGINLRSPGKGDRRDNEKIAYEERDEDHEEGSDDQDGKCWLRGLVVETLSKDQGWSSAVSANPKLYGTSLPFYILKYLFPTEWPLLYVCEDLEANKSRDIRSQLLVVRNIPLSRWKRGG